MSSRLRFISGRESLHSFSKVVTRFGTPLFGKFLNRPVSEESLKLEGSSQNDRSLTEERVMHGVQVSTEGFNLIPMQSMEDLS